MAPSDTQRWRLDSDESTSETLCVSSSLGAEFGKVKNVQNHHKYSNVPLFESHSIFRNPESTLGNDFPSIAVAKPLCQVYSVDGDFDDKENDPFVSISSTCRRLDSENVIFLINPLYEIEGRGYILPYYNQTCTLSN
mmetsp:Transcript_17193/g.32546  ORF Transcript_17193/g.32546 Transcript_17193/m.32546 type:complete len:137 (+) Transcript_17193:40-450(+)